MKCLKLSAIRSFAFPDVHRRCDGSGVTKWLATEVELLTASTNHQGHEKFYIVPVEVPPSLASETHLKVAILSFHFNSVFIRLDSQGMSHFDADGGGQVNCQFTAHSYEIFFIKQEKNGCYSFRSVQFPHCYIRLDGRGVHSSYASGGGTVNCQWYDASKPLGKYELFYVEEH